VDARFRYGHISSTPRHFLLDCILFVAFLLILLEFLLLLDDFLHLVSQIDILNPLDRIFGHDFLLFLLLVLGFQQLFLLQSGNSTESDEFLNSILPVFALQREFHVGFPQQYLVTVEFLESRRQMLSVGLFSQSYPQFVDQTRPRNQLSEVLHRYSVFVPLHKRFNSGHEVVLVQDVKFLPDCRVLRNVSGHFQDVFRLEKPVPVNVVEVKYKLSFL